MLNDILTAAAVVGSLGLILGILLALFIRFFGIEEDKRIAEIREVLPGINCGACGYKGCSDYAEAIAKGNAAPNLCIPGAKASAEAIGEILGVEVEEPKDVVAFVACNGTCDVAQSKAIYDGIDTCRASSMIWGGPKACSYGCIGCGDCADACISHAICMESGVARVDTALCIGCGVCAKTCPKKVIMMIPQEAGTVVYCSSRDRGADAKRSCSVACIGCKKCEKTCPLGAIEVCDNIARIDYSKCTGCGLCTEACPTGCLKKSQFPDLPENFDLEKAKA